jgi:hypothetical protein
MDNTNEYYLYQGNVYHCSECTTEGELVGHYGGTCLLFLDELGNYVDANDCVKVESPNLWQRLRFWIFANVWLKAIRAKHKFKDLFRPKYDDVPFDDYVPFDDCEF